jgi:hypothetical protein
MKKGRKFENYLKRYATPTIFRHLPRAVTVKYNIYDQFGLTHQITIHKDEIVKKNIPEGKKMSRMRKKEVVQKNRV